MGLSYLLSLMLFALVFSDLGAYAQNCGRQAGGVLCAGGLCCSQWGFCGTTPQHCTTGCQSQCSGSTGGGGGVVSDLSSIIPQATFERMLLHRNEATCTAKGFYTYNAFIAAANSFSAFGTTGDSDMRKREIAAFFAQTSHETTGGWATAPDGPYSWGYCFIQERNPTKNFCDMSKPQWPCAPGKNYYGRGPMQLSYNYNYGQAGQALGVDLLNNPDLVVLDPVIAFKTALWFWMTTQSPKPSPHDVITGRWSPSAADSAAGRTPGFGLITNIINGGEECGKGLNDKVTDRIGYYKRYCDLLGVSYGNNLDCYNQSPYQ